MNFETIKTGAQNGFEKIKTISSNVAEKVTNVAGHLPETAESIYQSNAGQFIANFLFPMGNKAINEKEGFVKTAFGFVADLALSGLSIMKLREGKIFSGILLKGLNYLGQKFI